jgi:hypothetical protein
MDTTGIYLKFSSADVKTVEKAEVLICYQGLFMKVSRGVGFVTNPTQAAYTGSTIPVLNCYFSITPGVLPSAERLSLANKT